MDKNITRFILNFIITGVLILIFRNVGWISFDNPPVIIMESDYILNLVIIAGIIGSVMLIIGEIFEVLYKISKIATLGFAKLFYPLYFVIVGYLKLFIPTLILAGWYSHTFRILPVLFISILIGLIRIPKK